MYQFTTETILNSILDSNETTSKFTGANGIFNVTRVGTFKTAEVISCFKNPYLAAVNEKVVKTITGTVTATKVYRLAIKLKRVDSYTSEFANDMSYNALEKFYEVTGVATPAALVTAFAKIIKRESVLKDNFYFVVGDDKAAEITFTATDEFTRFVKIEIQELLDVNPTGYNQYSLFNDVLASATVTAGAIGFGTVKQITRNLRLPTLANTNWTSINQEERPVAGGQYDQFSIKIKTNRGAMGMNAVGDDVNSITDHIFYVLKGDVGTAFEAALTSAGITVLAAKGGAGALKLVYSDSTIVIDDTTTPTLTGAKGAVVYTSATEAVATVVAATGVVTGVTAGTSVITATDAVGNTGTFTVTVIA